MFPIEWSREDGLDVALLGTIIAGLGAYAGAFLGSADATPSLIRFFQVSPDTTYVAVLPQDKALLLLTDPRTADAASGGVEAPGGIGLTLIAVGAVLVTMGVLAARSGR